MTGQITTAAELDVLPVGTILADDGNHPVWRDRVSGWCASNGAREIDPEVVISDGGPLTVLYRADVPHVIPGQNPGKPSAEAVADALIQYETGGCCGFGTTCGLCDCGKADETPEQTQTRDAMELDRARAVLALFPEQRCAPSEDEVMNLIMSCAGGVAALNETRVAAAMAEVVARLYADQPTVAQAKAEALREMGKWFRLASQLGTGERDEIAAQACFDRADAIESGGDR